MCQSKMCLVQEKCPAHRFSISLETFCILLGRLMDQLLHSEFFGEAGPPAGGLGWAYEAAPGERGKATPQGPPAEGPVAPRTVKHGKYEILETLIVYHAIIFNNAVATMLGTNPGNKQI